jgi:glycosyltransferase involved in cell wall biosynthesis
VYKIPHPKIEKEKLRLAIVHPAPYPVKLPLFDIVCTKTDGIVLFSSKYSIEHPEWNIDEILEQVRFKYRFLPGFAIRGTHIRPSVLWYLWRYKPDVIVAGDFFLQTLFALIYACLFRSKILIHSNATRQTGVMHAKRKWFRQWLVRHCDGFIAASSETKKYLCELGAKPDTVFISIQTIDVHRWKQLVEEEKKSQDNLKSELGLNDKVIIYVGRLVSFKGVHLLIEAFHRVAEMIHNVSILLVGGGSEEAKLKEYCKQKNLSEKIKFVGYKQPRELPQYYAVADLFVFPTLGEPFGLIVNEALASGLPVICSPFAGAAELIQEGENGYIVDPRDTKKLSEVLATVLTDENLLQSLKLGALDSIENFTIEKSAEQFLKAIEFVTTKI